MRPRICRSCRRIFTVDSIGVHPCTKCGTEARVHELTGEDVWHAVVGAARQLAAEQWYSSCTYEPTSVDIADRARSQAKADVGRALLEALGATEAE